MNIEQHPFLDAVKKGDVASVEAQLKEAPSLASTRDGQGVSAVLLSLFYRQSAVTDALLRAAPSLDMFEAATLGSVDILQERVSTDRTLLHAFTSQGFTPLGLAAFMGHTDAVAWLLDHGAAIDTVDRSFNANTALDAAVAGNHTETALLLLTRGASVHARDGAQHTPLHKAAHHANLLLIEDMVRRGADREAQNKDGKTPADMVPAGRDDASKLLNPA